MSLILRRASFYFFTISLFSACALSPQKDDYQFTLIGRDHLAAFPQWRIEGRIVLRNQQQAWSANLEWQHNDQQDYLLLSGPFGQGAVRIYLHGKSIEIDYGDGYKLASENAKQLIHQQLGFYVPTQALRFWLMGIVVPQTPYVEIDRGFTQLGWTVSYSQYVQVDNHFLPKKIKVWNQEESLKLFIDQWDINNVPG